MTRVAPTTVHVERGRAAQRAQLAYVTRVAQAALFDDAVTTDGVEFPAISDFHGTAEATWLVRFMRTEAPSGAGPGILTQAGFTTSDDDNVWTVGGHSSGSMRWAAYTGSGASALIAPALSSYTPAVGEWAQMLWAYEGAGGTDADKIKLWYRNRDSDPWTQDGGLTFPNEAIPAVLRTPTVGDTIRVGRGLSNRFSGLVTDIRWHSSRLISSGERDAITMDAADSDVWEHWYRPISLDYGWNDQLAALDGAELDTLTWHYRHGVSRRGSEQGASLVEDSGDARRYLKAGTTAGAHLAYLGSGRRLSIISAPVA